MMPRTHLTSSQAVVADLLEAEQHDLQLLECLLR